MFQREQQWQEEQEQVVDNLNRIEEEMETQTEKLPTKRYFYSVFLLKNLNINKRKWANKLLKHTPCFVKIDQ